MSELSYPSQLGYRLFNSLFSLKDRIDYRIDSVRTGWNNLSVGKKVGIAGVVAGAAIMGISALSTTYWGNAIQDLYQIIMNTPTSQERWELFLNSQEKLEFLRKLEDISYYSFLAGSGVILGSMNYLSWTLLKPRKRSM
jgi:hypothetical protein